MTTREPDPFPRRNDVPAGEIRYVVPRWTVDCWSPGCGWSKTGFEAVPLHEAWIAHVSEHHPKGGAQ